MKNRRPSPLARYAAPWTALALLSVLAGGCEADRARDDEPRTAGGSAPGGRGTSEAAPKDGACADAPREVSIDRLLAEPERYSGAHVTLRGAEVVTRVTRNQGPAARQWLRRQMRGEEDPSDGELPCLALQELVPAGRSRGTSARLDLTRDGAAIFCEGSGCARDGYRCPIDEGAAALDGVFHYHERMMLGELAVCPGGQSALAEPTE